METPQKSMTYEPETKDTYRDKASKTADRRTFILPFVILTFLTLPLLAVLAFSKPTAGFTVLVTLGYYDLIQAFFWLTIPVAVLCGVLYIIRADGVWGKVAVALLGTLLAMAFGYVVSPS